MRRIAFALSFVLIGSSLLAPTARADETGSLMADAARRFVAALDESRKAQATFSFDDPERFNWHWIPRDRKGLPIKAMGPEQRSLAFGLLATGLSTKGFVRATTIMSLEEILRIDEQGTGPVRDSELYYFSVFGTPGDSGSWAWRVEGHHLALNFTLRDGRVVSATPFMLGSNPALVKVGTRQGLRNLATVELPSNDLARSLTPEQQKLAVTAPTAAEPPTTPNSPQAAAAAPEGLGMDQLDPAQRKTLVGIVRDYAGNFADPIRDALLDQMRQGESSAHLAWRGPVDPVQPHAFTIQSSTFFIDYNDTQNGANHIHTYYRSLLGDFGVPVAR